MALSELQPGIFIEKKKHATFWTKNLTPGEKVYDERLIQGGKLRQWSIRKSKLGAALAKGLTKIPIKKGDVVLYLGASTGTTVSHLSDVLEGGMIFAVEFSFYMLRRLLFLAEKRKNIAPILADANHPERYQGQICQADFLFQDIAQKNQVEIFCKHLKFLKPKKFAMLCVKAKCIDITAPPRKVYRQVEKELEKRGKIVWKKQLDPFEKDHCMFMIQKN